MLSQTCWGAWHECYAFGSVNRNIMKVCAHILLHIFFEYIIYNHCTYHMYSMQIMIDILVPLFYFIVDLYILSLLSGPPNSEMRLSPGPRLQRIDGTIRQKYLRGRLCILFLTKALSWPMLPCEAWTSTCARQFFCKQQPACTTICLMGRQELRRDAEKANETKTRRSCQNQCVSVSFAKLRIRLERMIPAPDAEFISQSNLECHKFVSRSCLLKGKCIKAYQVPCC